MVREGVEFSLESRAVAVGGQLLTINGLAGRYEDIFLPLHGKHQGSNAASALAAVESFFGSQELDHETVHAGFGAVSSPGRFEIVHRNPTVILDAAHNPHGAKALADTLENEFTFDEIIGVIGVFADKDAEGILRELEPVINILFVTSSSSPRAMKSDELKRIADRVFGADRVIHISHLENALKQAIADARRPPTEDSVGVVVTGSVVTVGEARAIVKRLALQ